MHRCIASEDWFDTDVDNGVASVVGRVISVMWIANELRKPLRHAFEVYSGSCTIPEIHHTHLKIAQLRATDQTLTVRRAPRTLCVRPRSWCI